MPLAETSVLCGAERIALLAPPASGWIVLFAIYLPLLFHSLNGL
jgi:succinate dehydrogenase/fumarate reductase cytochrome b subunit